MSLFKNFLKKSYIIIFCLCVTMNLMYHRTLTTSYFIGNIDGELTHELAIDDSDDMRHTPVADEHGMLDDTQIKQTAVVVTTNWIPSAPSIQMIQEVLDSLDMIKGLPPNAPTYIILDALDIKREPGGQGRWDKEETLDLYSTNLMKEYMHRQNFHIVVNNVNLHVGGNLNKAIELLPPETEFLYFIQHDLKFVKEVNHTAIIKTMKEYPDIFRNIRFGKGPNGPRKSGRRSDDCWHMKGSSQEKNGITLSRTHKWSDNNQFASVEYYKEILGKIRSIRRPMEAPMMASFQNTPGCNMNLTQHLYGGYGDGPYIDHLDGRLSYTVGNVTTV